MFLIGPEPEEHQDKQLRVGKSKKAECWLWKIDEEAEGGA